MHFIDDEKLKQILNLRKSGKTYLEIKQITGCSKGTISKYCLKYGLSEHSNILNITPELLLEIQKRYEEVGSIKKVAKEYHTSLTRLRTLGLKLINKPKNKTNSEYTPQARSAQKIKKKAVEYKGGKCQICGYNKCMRALTFHHIDPKTKSFGISGAYKSWERLKPELDKCILVCQNCHAEIHDGLLKIDESSLK